MKYAIFYLFLLSVMNTYAGDALDMDKAVRSGNPETVSTLIDNGVSPSIILSEGKNKMWQHSPLILAAKKNNIEMVKLLIKEGADVNYANMGSDTALKIAAKKDFTEIASLLIAAGADVNFVDDNEVPVLFWAVSYKSKNVIPLLITAGADPDQQYSTLEHGTISVRSYFTNKGSSYSSVVDLLN